MELPRIFPNVPVIQLNKTPKHLCLRRVISSVLFIFKNTACNFTRNITQFHILVYLRVRCVDTACNVRDELLSTPWVYKSHLYLHFFGYSEVNSTWLITSELANQRARKALFTCVVYAKNSIEVTPTGLTRTVGVMMARAKKNYILIMKVNLN